MIQRCVRRLVDFFNLVNMQPDRESPGEGSPYEGSPNEGSPNEGSPDKGSPVVEIRSAVEFTSDEQDNNRCVKLRDAYTVINEMAVCKITKNEGCKLLQNSSHKCRKRKAVETDEPQNMKRMCKVTTQTETIAITPESNKLEPHYIWTKGAKKNMAYAGLYRRFPDTDRELAAYARFAENVGFPKTTTETDIPRISSAFYFVQQSEGSVPHTLSVDAIMDTEPFSQFFSILNEILNPITVRCYSISLQRFLKYVDFERNRNGIRSEVIAHMDKFLKLLQKGADKKARKQMCIKQYSEEALKHELPDIDLLRKQYQALLPEMRVLIGQYKERNKTVVNACDFIKPSKLEFSDVTQYLMTIIVIDHAQRPGVCQNMTVKEVLNAIKSDDSEFYTICIYEHKSSSSKPATVCFKASEYQLLLDYLEYFRGTFMEGDDNPEKSRFFRNCSGQPYSKSSGNAVKRFHQRHAMPHVSSSQSRKAQETKNKNLSEADRLLCHKYLSHSRHVAEYFYVQPDLEEAVKARKLMLGEGKMLDEDKKMHEETVEEEEVKKPSIKQKAEFSQDIFRAKISDDEIQAHVKLQNWTGIKKKIDEYGHPDVVATEAFSIGDIVCEYKGTLLDPWQTTQFKENLDKVNSGSAEDQRYLQFMFKGARWLIDARDEPEDQQASLGGLIKHSQHYPNLKYEVYVINDIPHILLVCLRPIQDGDELSLNYGPTRTVPKALMSAKKKPDKRSLSWENKQKLVFGLSVEEIQSLTRKMQNGHLLASTPSEEWLLDLITPSENASDQDLIVKALQFHHQCTKASRLIKHSYKRLGVPAFKIIEQCEDANRALNQLEIYDILEELRVGNGGEARHTDRETRTEMAADYAIELMFYWNGVKPTESSEEIPPKRKQNTLQQIMQKRKPSKLAIARAVKRKSEMKKALKPSKGQSVKRPQGVTKKKKPSKHAMTSTAERKSKKKKACKPSKGQSVKRLQGVTKKKKPSKHGMTSAAKRKIEKKKVRKPSKGQSVKGKELAKKNRKPGKLADRQVTKSGGKKTEKIKSLKKAVAKGGKETCKKGKTSILIVKLNKGNTKTKKPSKPPESPTTNRVHVHTNKKNAIKPSEEPAAKAMTTVKETSLAIYDFVD